MPKTFIVTFPNGGAATAADVKDSAELVEAITEMGLVQSRPTMVLVGGAAGLQPADLNRLRPIFTEALVPLVSHLGAAVVDGGTDAGVMGLMGRARDAAKARFPLIGVLPIGMVDLPVTPPRTGGTLEVEPHHSHLILVPGSRWGDESPWMTSTVKAMAAGSPSVTVLVDGGETAWEDVAESVRAGRPVIVVEGSGRVADILAAALSGSDAEERALRLAGSGLLTSVRLNQGPNALAEAVTVILSAT